MTVRIRSGAVTFAAAFIVAGVLTGCTQASPAAEGSSPTKAATATPSAEQTSSDAPTTPDPTATAEVSKFRLDDPATWTISGDEVGPVALGGALNGELDDLTAAYKRSTDECPAAPETTFWANGKNPALIVSDRAGTVSGVAVGNYEPDAVTTNSPRTTAGAGVGTSLTDLQVMYPQLTYIGTYGEERAAYSMWGINDGGGHITFQLGDDGAHVGLVWVSDVQKPPYEFCA